MIEILKLLAAILCGGLAGSLLTQWFQRRASRLQRIPLIERVNRIVTHELQGITLARRTATTGDDLPQLEELKNLREYQLTLRNTSTVHLRDAEIQFEFPTEDAQAWASRPALSKTALVATAGTPTEPWKKSFRWRIPYLPSGDSVEFTFQAVNPPSESYEVALYGSDRVIIEKVEGEPPSKAKTTSRREYAILVVILLLIPLVDLFKADNPDRGVPVASTLNRGNCTLHLTSEFDGLTAAFRGSWEITNRIANTGSEPCVFLSTRLEEGRPLSVAPGQTIERRTPTTSRPKIATSEVQFGVTVTGLSKTDVQLYTAQ